jgi:hypothetical protein
MAPDLQYVECGRNNSLIISVGLTIIENGEHWIVTRESDTYTFVTYEPHRAGDKYTARMKDGELRVTFRPGNVRMTFDVENVASIQSFERNVQPAPEQAPGGIGSSVASFVARLSPF